MKRKISAEIADLAHELSVRCRTISKLIALQPKIKGADRTKALKLVDEFDQLAKLTKRRRGKARKS